MVMHFSRIVQESGLVKTLHSVLRLKNRSFSSNGMYA